MRFSGGMNSESKTPAADYNGSGGVAAVNDDVLAEILVRSPAKFVTKLKLVSKRWLSLISGDQFRRLHTLRRHKPQPSLLLRSYTSGLFFYFNPITNGEKVMIPYNFPFHNPKILSSCNGLMLLQCDNPQTDYYVYNPTTKQSRKIIVSNDRDYPDIEGLSLAFDPSKSAHYKIVCVRGSRKELPVERSYRIQVYDSVSHTWDLCMEPFTDSRFIHFSYGVHCHNSIYWKMLDALLSFDIDKNVVVFLPYPEFPWAEHQRDVFRASQLQESNGNLYFFITKPGGRSIAVWELQGDDHSQWFLKCHDRLPCTRPLGSRYSISPLRFVSGSYGDETTSILVSHGPGKIRAYNFLYKRFEELVDLTDQPFYHENYLQFGFRDVYQFGESLAVV